MPCAYCGSLHHDVKVCPWKKPANTRTALLANMYLRQQVARDMVEGRELSLNNENKEEDGSDDQPTAEPVGTDEGSD